MTCLGMFKAHAILGQSELMIKQVDYRRPE